MLSELDVRRSSKRQSGRVIQRGTVLESAACGQVEDPGYELSRMGRRYAGGNQIIANGIAPVAAIPTTTATLGLFNAESDGGPVLVVRRLGLWLGSGTPAAGATLLACVSPAKLATAVAANATGYGSASLSGGSRATKARWGTALTLPGTPAWFQVLSTLQLAAANVGQGDQVSDLEGMIVVPPGYVLGLAILSGAGTTPLYGVSAVWSEPETDLE